MFELFFYLSNIPNAEKWRQILCVVALSTLPIRPEQTTYFYLPDRALLCLWKVFIKPPNKLGFA